MTLKNNYKEIVDNALDKFYKKNDIQKDKYYANGNPKDNQGKYKDRFIGEDVFEQNVRKWLKTFEVGDREKMLKLIEEYLYITEPKMECMVFDLIEEVKKKLDEKNNKIDRCLFVTVESSFKSGGDNIRCLLNKNCLNDITKKQIVASVSKPEKIKLYIEEAETIVFIDDIIGTGKTTLKNIEEMHKNFKHFKNKEIIVASICAKKDKVDNLKKQLEKINIEASFINMENLVDCFQHISNMRRQQNDIKTTIKKYEKIVDGHREKFYLGFEKSRVLVSFYYETPNNTLCNFWKYTKESEPLFPRQTQKRLKISDLNEKKERNKENAYNAGRVINSGNK